MLFVSGLSLTVGNDEEREINDENGKIPKFITAEVSQGLPAQKAVDECHHLKIRNKSELHIKLTMVSLFWVNLPSRSSNQQHIRKVQISHFTNKTSV